MCKSGVKLQGVSENGLTFQSESLRRERVRVPNPSCHLFRRSTTQLDSGPLAHGKGKFGRAVHTLQTNPRVTLKDPESRYTTYLNSMTFFHLHEQSVGQVGVNGESLYGVLTRTLVSPKTITKNTQLKHNVLN